MTSTPPAWNGGRYEHQATLLPRAAHHRHLRHARFILILVILQLWLLTATMNAYLGGDEAVIWPAAAASLFCLLLNVGLLRYLYLHRAGAALMTAPQLQLPAAVRHLRPRQAWRHCTRPTSRW